jgi:hypothetical protein
VNGWSATDLGPERSEEDEMFGPSDRSGGDTARPSLDSVRFDTDSYEFRGEPAPVKASQ